MKVSMEHWLNDTDSGEKKPVPPQILYGLTRDWTRSSAANRLSHGVANINLYVSGHTA